MLNFQDLNLNFYALEPLLKTHPYITNMLAFFIAFIEAMVVVGIVIPGAIVMPIIGFLIGATIIPSDNIILWAVLGAIMGDCLNYFLGFHFKERIRSMWPFTRWPNLFERSAKFFRHHGGKSVFLGRFIGPIRAFIPMIAGMFRMSFGNFLLVTIPAAAVWTLSGIVPGIFIGALSLELPPKMATKFILGCLCIFLVLWLIIWLTHRFFKQLCQIFERAMIQLWGYWKKHSKHSKIINFLSDPRIPDNHQQLTLITLATLTILLFLGAWYQLSTHGFLVDFGQIVNSLFSSMRVDYLDRFFVLITFFGDASVIALTTGAILLWLIWKKQWYSARALTGIMIMGLGIIVPLKFFLHSPRPGGVIYNGIMHNIAESSFPSAHTTICCIFYGFLAVIIAHDFKSIKKYLTYIIASTVITLIAISRLYLGAHWLIDIIGGILLGFTILLTATVLYRRRRIPYFNTQKLALVACVFLSIIWLGYSTLNFSRLFKEYTLIWPHQTIMLKELLQNPQPDLPLYRTNRLGQPSTAFNVVYIGKLTALEHALRQQDWEIQSQEMNLKTLIKSFYSSSAYSQLPILPQLYHNRQAELFMKKYIEKPQQALVTLRLWQADIDLTEQKLPVWLGTIVQHNSTKDAPLTFKHLKQTKRPFLGATELLRTNLEYYDFSMWQKPYPQEIQPKEMVAPQWDGKLLVILENN